MKILFLQKVDNARGGIATVNLKLMNYFLSLNHQVDVLSVRHGDTWEHNPYPEDAKLHLINEKEVWGVPRLKDCIACMKKGDMIQAFCILIKRFDYKKKIKRDYQLCQRKIEELAPDVIINSHYEILEGISKKYLKKTIMHFHTSFDQVLENKSYQTFFKKYANEIFCFLWLSEKTKEEAIQYGFTNSVYIYNPLPFTESDTIDVNHKKLIFLGRLSEEKRIHLAIEYFQEVVSEEQLTDWSFEIYGDGPLKEQVISMIQGKKQITYMGRTENVRQVLKESSVLVLTSDFEGMPLVVLEANECGVPAIVYDFGESSHEVICNGKTGLIIPQNDKEAFKEAMKKIFKDETYRLSMSKEAKEFAKKFSIENIGQQWLDLFQKMEY